MKEIKYVQLRKENKEGVLEAISKIIKETDAHEQLSAKKSMWNWQYEELPSNKSLVYVAIQIQENRIIGYYHIPTYKIRVGNEILKLGHIQSVAVLKEFRNLGVFQKLASFANKEADKHLDLIYTFPNQRSIHTFIKYNNFELVTELPMYLLPIDSKKIINSRINLLGLESALGITLDGFFKSKRKKITSSEKVVFINDIDEEIAELFRNFSLKHHLSLVRDKEFLQWRYLNSPKGQYIFVGLKDEENLSAVAILKKENIFSNDGLVLMDVAFKNIDHLMKLLTNLEGIFEEGLGAFILVSGLFSQLEELKSAGFIKVPRFLVPRNLNLLTRFIGENKSKEKLTTSSWLITLGDWDVF